MSLITDQTQIKLISRLSAASSFDSGDLLVIQRGLKSFKINRSNFVDSLADGSSIEKNGSDKLQIKNSGVTTSKISDSNVTKQKIENIANLRVLGNTTGAPTHPREVTVYDEDDMISDSNTGVATQQSIKAYVDTVTEFDFIMDESGYTELPSGLIMQWGTVTSTSTFTSVGFPLKIDFPIEFPTRVLYANVSPDGGDSGSTETSTVDWSSGEATNLTRLSFYINYIGVVKWIAIGH